MVKCVDQVSDVLAHVAVDVPFTGKKLGCLVNQVCGKDSVDDALLVSFVETLEAVGEEAEGCEDENLVCVSLLKCGTNLEH